MNSILKQWVSTTSNQEWKMEKPIFTEACEDTLTLTGETYQTVEGFGGCFNELGWIALSHVNESEKEQVIKALFSEEGCGFNICRMPIGASDYAAEWYSHNENAGDYQMEKFSIERDYDYLIPYIKKAKDIQPELKMFASPWSPPTWMKFPKAYNHGKMIWKKEILDAYALYFLKFVKAYEAEGIEIHQVHIQNEPVADQKFPSCVWTGEQLGEFIRDYIGPLFEKHNMKTEIWLGTLNCPYENYGGWEYIHTNYDNYANVVLSDPEARKYIKGVGYQWGGKNAIKQTYESWPEMGLMQTENECGDGNNTWEYAQYIFNLFKHYFECGVNSYIYWNMVLEPKGISTWGWKQNSMVTIDPSTKKTIFNPEFYVMKHFSHFIKKGAVRVGLKGHWAGSSVAFKNVSGETILIVYNGLSKERNFTYLQGEKTFTVKMAPHSFNTLVIHE